MSYRVKVNGVPVTLVECLATGNSLRDALGLNRSSRLYLRVLDTRKVIGLETPIVVRDGLEFLTEEICMSSRQKSVVFHLGEVITCDTLAWDAGWEFDYPSIMLSPVVRCFENGSSHEGIVEDVMLSVILGRLTLSVDSDFDWAWRGWSVPYLRRCFREALAGKKFPKIGYRAERSYVVLNRKADSDLDWKSVDASTVLGTRYVKKWCDSLEGP